MVQNYNIPNSISLKDWLKPGIHYAIFAPISPRFYSLNKLTLVEESQSQSADYSWQIPQKIAWCTMATDSDFLASDFDSIQS